jgi:hypothetical protein
LLPIFRCQVEVRPGVESELARDFFAYLITADADAWTDSGVNVGRIGPKPCAHLVEGLYGYPAGSAAPSGMNGGHGSILGIRQQDRVTVGGTDGNSQAEPIGDESISFPATDTGIYRLKYEV